MLDLYLTFAEGGTARLDVPVTCGTASAADPTGPDAWGYYAFDDLDAGYTIAPVYDWVEIDPALGGAGTALALADTALYADGVAVIDLPFPFRYYGRTFTKVSVCSNGWFSFGATPVLYYRNWKIPTPAPPTTWSPSSGTSCARPRARAASLPGTTRRSTAS